MPLAEKFSMLLQLYGLLKLLAELFSLQMSSSADLNNGNFLSKTKRLKCPFLQPESGGQSKVCSTHSILDSPRRKPQARELQTLTRYKMSLS